ncbi:MAG: cation diffusion facilitator family transporter [Nitrospinota bacterium]|nr:cation diffusion facilitator family transporter [Nitrospinota bacterium]
MKSALIKKRLRLAIFFTLIILTMETVGGILSGSLALLSDAVHIFMDGFALCLSLAAITISERPSTNTQTYGYHRIEIFAAFVNGVFLFGLACTILYESYQRFINPHEVKSLVVILVALVGLLANLSVIYLLKDMPTSRDLNLKSAFYHVLGDSLASVGVIAGGIVMYYTHWYTLDALTGAAIGCLLIWGTKTIIADSVHILLEGVPKGISIPEVQKELTAIPAIKDIHELHIWCLCSNIYAFSAHVLIKDQTVEQVESTLKDIKAVLKDRFNISHSTIQFECNSCIEAPVLCEMRHEAH